MRYTWYDKFVIVLPGFSQRESDIGTDIRISTDILAISNQKNRYPTFIKEM